MKKWFLHIFLAGVLGMLAASCVTDDELDGMCTETEKVMVRFTIALDKSEAVSRATWEDYDPEANPSNGLVGLETENYINPNTVQVLLYDMNGILMHRMDVVRVTVDDNDSNKHVYDLVGSFEAKSSEVSNLNFKMMVFANCPAIQDLDDFYNLTYDYTNWDITKGIPMWGIGTFTGVDLSNSLSATNESTLVTLDTPIYMLRSMAKIEVIMKDTKHQITSIAIENYNNTGNCVPAGYSSAIDTRKLNRNDVFRATTDIKAESCPFIANVSDVIIKENGADKNYKCYTIYVPEYKNMDGTSAVTNPSRIAIQVDDKTNKTYYVYYGTAGKNTEYNIVRNHIYRYNITKVNDGAELELTLVVNPWDVIEENIQFTDEVTVKQKMQWSGTYKPNTDDASILYIDNAINDATAATVTFQIDTPVGATWYASFEGDKDSFAFLDEDGNELTSITGNVGESATLKIVTKEEHVGEMKSVSLMIVVRTMDGRTIMVNKDLMPEALKDKDYFQLRQNLSI